MDKRYFSQEKQEKYCSAGDHILSLRMFRKSSKASKMYSNSSGYYASYCKVCESDCAKIRQSVRRGYKTQTNTITKKLKESLIKRTRETLKSEEFQ